MTLINQYININKGPCQYFIREIKGEERSMKERERDKEKERRVKDRKLNYIDQLKHTQK